MTSQKTWFRPVYWSVLIFIIAQALTFLVAARENTFLQVNHIYIPPSPPDAIVILPQPSQPVPPGQTPAPEVGSLAPMLLYFASVIVVLGLILFLVPVSALRLFLRVIFALIFTWGIFVILVFWLPPLVSIIIAAAVGLTWVIFPRVLLHNAVMLLSMVSLAAVFGRLITPWTAMVLIVVLAVYDFLAVRFGYMVWMAKRMSESTTLPAFVIPYSNAEWKASLKQSSVTRLVEEKPSERDYSILGGGDIGFPVLLTSSVYFGYGFGEALFVAIFSMFGLIGAYWIQSALLKGRPVPALPPIAAFTLLALFIIRVSGL